MTQKVALLISYDGTDFQGWQKQNQGQRTVQETIEKVLNRLFQEPINVMGAGRTDSGVHANGQVVCFNAPKDPLKFNLLRSMNSYLPKDVAVMNGWLVPEDFHPIASSVSKTYKYTVYNSSTPHALAVRTATWERRPLDINVLNELSQALIGKKDFKSFQSKGTDVKTTVREIFQAEWKKEEENLIIFTISGSGFLKQMVRNIVGTTLDLFHTKASKQELIEIIEKKDRRAAGRTAAPEGLNLYAVKYSEELDKRCRKI